MGGELDWPFSGAHPSIYMKIYRPNFRQTLRPTSFLFLCGSCLTIWGRLKWRRKKVHWKYKIRAIFSFRYLFTLYIKHKTLTCFSNNIKFNRLGLFSLQNYYYYTPKWVIWETKFAMKIDLWRHFNVSLVFQHLFLDILLLPQMG